MAPDEITDDEALEIASVTALFESYEAALLANDIEALNSAFWHDPRTLRFGIADSQVGFDEVVAWRAAAEPVSPARTITSRHVHRLGPGVVSVDITFVNGGAPIIGRQSQTWIRTPDGWRIARAHVSVIER